MPRLPWRRREHPRKLPDFLNVPWTLRDLLLFGLAWLGLQVVFILVLRAMAPAVPAASQFLSGLVDGNIGVSFAFSLIDAGIGMGVIAVILRKYGVGWKVLGWQPVNIRRMVLYMLGILVFFVVSVNVVLLLVTILVPHFNPNQAQQNDFTQAAGSHHNLALIALVLLPPILEETIFRGFIFPALSKRMGVVWGAIFSSVIFGVAHWQANVSIYTFVLGLLLCFMYVRLRSIVPGIFLHMANNYLAFLALSGK
ncbi:MAG: putative metal-dependent rane protease [Patescibacteria group bacterium]|nr:putative metal-dependent rane protease [Patescibacteria group bacterium]